MRRLLILLAGRRCGRAFPPRRLSVSRNPTMLIRADASSQIGLGHVTRAAALGQAWRRRGGEVVFAAAEMPAELQTRLVATGFDLRMLEAGANDLADTTRIASATGARWVVVDGYHFDADYHAALQRAGLFVAAYDDEGAAERYVADVIINQCFSDESLYANRCNAVRLLLGPRYAAIRPQFFDQRAERETVAEANRVLVTFGGADPQGLTLRALNALSKINDRRLEIFVVAGAASKPQNPFESAVARAGHSLRFERDTQRMPMLMAWADLAVTAGGTTCLEMCAMGLPQAIIVAAENQRRLAAEVAALGEQTNLGWWEDVTQSKITKSVSSLLADRRLRHRMSQSGSRLVDMQGGNRVAAMLEMVAHAAKAA